MSRHIPALPPPRDRRAWNTFSRWLKLHPIILRLQRGVATASLYGVVRNVDRARARQHMQLTRGGKTGDGSDAFDSWEDCSCLEPQGFTAGVPLGARGLIHKPGGTPEFTAAVGVCRYQDRPKFLKAAEVCVWTPFGSRMFAAEDGSIVIGTDLADYKADPADLDEGAKLRLKHAGVKGDAEVYGEHEVRQRAQPAGGAGASASTKLESSGTATFMVDDGGGTTASISMLNGSITVENAAGAKVELKADGSIAITAPGGAAVDVTGDVVVTASGNAKIAASEVWLGSAVGGEVGLVALAQHTQASLDSLELAFNSHSHANHGVAPTPVPGVIPPSIEDVAAANVKAKTS